MIIYSEISKPMMKACFRFWNKVLQKSFEVSTESFDSMKFGTSLIRIIQDK